MTDHTNWNDLVSTIASAVVICFVIWGWTKR